MEFHGEELQQYHNSVGQNPYYNNGFSAPGVISQPQGMSYPLNPNINNGSYQQTSINNNMVSTNGNGYSQMYEDIGNLLNNYCHSQKIILKFFFPHKIYISQDQDDAGPKMYKKEKKQKTKNTSKGIYNRTYIIRITTQIS